MNRKKRSTAIGAALVILLLVFTVGKFQGDDRIWQGQLLRRPQGGVSKPEQPDLTEPSVPAGPAVQGMVFTAADGAKVSMQYGDGCRYRPNVAALLQQPLFWALASEEPTVLIIHTHASESYTPVAGQNYVQTTQYRTLDIQYNMVALGDALAAMLEKAGIAVIHDRSLHDYPSYNDSYTNARNAAYALLQQYPSIQVVLDLHRDAILNANGTQFAPVVEVNGKSVAKLMLVVGTDGSGMHHPNWQENLAAAIKLQILLEKQAPGITRPILLRAQRFNHDLSTGAMIVEIGAAGNTFQEAMGAVEYLAQALIGLMHGSTTADSTS